VAELGYGASYRVLDAQNFGVPQRRRRVFVVGHLGDWKPTAEVLFESESLQWHPKKSKKAREDATGYIEGGFGAYNKSDVGGTTKASGGVLGGGSETFIHVADKAGPLLARDNKGLGVDDIHSKSIVEVFENHASDSRVKEMGDVCQTVTASWGTGGGNVPFALAENTIGRQPLNGGNGDGYTEKTPMYTLNATGVHGVSNQMAVRKLTPVECERLQGFPDNYTNIKENCPDGHRYKAMGNSMAVPVMKWIGTRINNYKEDTNAV
jgi:DNA (cytosine-5)-methyltransferase 1